MLKKLLKRLGVLALASILAALLAEGIVLVFLGEQVRFPRHVVGAPWGLRYNIPGSEYRHKSPDVNVRFRINGQGMRADEEVAYEKTPGRKRIISIGDSFTIGYEVEAHETFSAVLERTLQGLGYDVEVLNAGVSGFSTAEALLYLERELIKYQPDLVLHSYYTNDIRDNVRTGLFDVDDAGRLVQTGEEYVPLGGVANYLNSSTVFSLLSQYSNAFSFMKNELTNILKQRMVDEQIEETAARKGIDIDEWREKLNDVEHNQVEPLPEQEGAGNGGSAGRLGPMDWVGEPGSAFQDEASPGDDSAQDVPEALQPVFRGRILCCRIYERMYAFLQQQGKAQGKPDGIPLVIHSIPYQGDGREDEMGAEDETEEERARREENRRKRIEKNGGPLELIDTFPANCFNSRRKSVSVVYAKRYLDSFINKEPLYHLRSNRHWTPRAHEVSGKAIAHHIDRWKLLGWE